MLSEYEAFQWDQCSLSSFPLELWQSIIRFLPRSDQRTSLSVCKMFHDLTLPMLFSRIHIFFGDWDCRDDEFEGPEDIPDDEQQAKLMCDILQHIRRTPSFAKIVKFLSVCSYMNTIFHGTYEKWSLNEALGCMHNLRSFSWYGWCPVLNADIVDTLAVSCPLLREIVVPCRIPPSSFTSLARLNNLRSITYTDDLDDRYHPIDQTVADAESLKVVEANCTTLRSLAISDRVIWNSPIHVFRDLTHLEIFGPRNIENLILLFRHSEQLESLAFVMDVEVPEGLFTALRSSPSALPHLTSFKLCCERRTLRDTQVAALAEFVCQRKSLRRFDLATDCYEESMEPLWAVLPKLPDLQVLGMSLSRKPVCSHGEVQFLNQHLNPRLTALCITTNFDNSSLPPGEWANLYRRQNLQCVVHNDRGETVMNKHDLLLDPGSLQLVGWNGYICEIRRAGSEPATTPYWSDRKYTLRTVDDFGCDDWEWLLRHHDLSDDDFTF